MPHQDHQTSDGDEDGDFDDKFRRLTNLIASLPRGYPDTELIPQPNAPKQVILTENVLTTAASLIEPARDDSNTRWNAPVTQLAKQIEHNGDLQATSAEVSLLDIAEWTGQSTVIEVSTSGWDRRTEYRTVPAYIPPTAARKFFRQLNRARHDQNNQSRKQFHAANGGDDDEDNHPEPVGNADPPQDA